MADFAHADFWIAIATIAPVIFLSNAVLASQLLRRPSASMSTVFAYGCSVLAALACTLNMISALDALAGRRDRGIGLTGGARGLIIAAIVLTFAAAVIAPFEASGAEHEDEA